MYFAEDRPRNPGESATAWGVATGRISREHAAEWDSEIAAGKLSEQTVSNIVNVIAAGCETPLKTRIGAPSSVAVAASAFRPPAGKEPVYASNPLIEDILTTSRSLYQNALTAGPPPTLFSAGDLPAETMSGIDPAHLAKVPWTARHAIAAARTQAEAAELIELVSGPEGAENARMFEMDKHPGIRDYQARVNEWVDAGIRVEASRAQSAYEQRVMASAGMPAMTPDEQVEAMLAADEKRLDDTRRARDEQILNGRAVGHFMSADQVRAAAAAREIRAKQASL